MNCALSLLRVQLLNQIKLLSCNHCRHYVSHLSITKKHNFLVNYNVFKTYCTSNDNNASAVNDKIEKPIAKSIETKFKKYKDEDSRVIYDITEEALNEMLEVMPQTEQEMSYNYLYQEKKKMKLKDTDWTRGKTGVFDIQELVELLRDENMKDIAVIRLPKHLNYSRYMVLANGFSVRHLNSFMEYMNKIYKHKKSPKDPYLHFEKEMNDDWRVVDLKNIILHLFMEEVREYYDIETLWCVGEAYDDKTQRPEVDEVLDIFDKQMKFMQEIQPIN